MDNHTPRPLTDRDEAPLIRLADHAAIAIQNARLSMYTTIDQLLTSESGLTMPVVVPSVDLFKVLEGLEGDKALLGVHPQLSDASGRGP